MRVKDVKNMRLKSTTVVNNKTFVQVHESFKTFDDFVRTYAVITGNKGKYLEAHDLNTMNKMEERINRLKLNANASLSDLMYGKAYGSFAYLKRVILAAFFTYLLVTLLGYLMHN